MTWDIREVNIPRLPPSQARWLESGLLSSDYEFVVDSKIVATWKEQFSWATPEDVLEVIHKIRAEHYAQTEDIVIHGGWPRSGDRIAGVEMP